MTLQQTFDEFIYSRRLLGLTTKSIDCYASFNKPFLDYVGTEKDVFYLNYDDIKGYFSMLLEKPISVSTRATYTRHIKVFLSWLECEYNLDLNAYKISIPRTPKKNVYIYTPDEIKALYKAIDSPIQWLKLRNYTIISLMLDSGLRQNEVCQIEKKHINFKNNLLTVQGKGNKERVVALGKVTLSFLLEYEKQCPYSCEDYFILSSDGSKMTCNGVKIMVHRLSCILPFELSSHKLRHNFATNFCLDQYERNGQIDIFQLQVLMGHEDIKTTERYLHIANQIIASKNTISHLDDIFLLKN